MFRYMIAVFVWCLTTAVAQAAIIKSQHQVIDFTQPEQAAKLAKWSDPKTLGCNKDGFGWDGDGRSYRDGWIETEPLAIGTVWRPTQSAGIQIKLQTNYPAVVGKGNSKSLWKSNHDETVKASMMCRCQEAHARFAQDAKAFKNEP